ncbi:MAG: hypothetical protein J6L65_08710, partial [Lachnospiraceae bacterium]|nr:hypothetical protein [Lachnospiraceae bacterium]
LNVSDEMKLDDDRQNFCEELGAEELCSSSLDTFEELYSSSATDACGVRVLIDQALGGKEMKSNKIITVIFFLCCLALLVACGNVGQPGEVPEESLNPSEEDNADESVRVESEDDEFEALVRSTVNLSQNETIEKTEWIEENVCYRVAVERTTEVEGEYKHLTDYIFVKNETVKCVKVTYPSKLEATDADRYVYDACDFEVKYEDITFDEHKDIVISLGHQGAAGTCVSCAYVFENGDFVYVKTFEDIPNYSINDAQKCIDGFFKDKTFKYQFINGEFVELKQAISELALSKEIIDSYGYVGGYSVLSFEIVPQIVVEYDDCYVVDAIYAQSIEVPANLAIGERITVVFNELTGDQRTLERREDGFYQLEDEENEPYYPTYFRYFGSEGGTTITLIDENSDVVDKAVFKGKLYVRKDATIESTFDFSTEEVTKEKLNSKYSMFYDRVYFDENGYVTRLVHVGD